MAKVYVGRLSYDAGVQDLEDTFKRYGTINKIELKHGFAFVEYQNAPDAEDAINGLNGCEIKGSPIVVQPSKGSKESKSRIPKTDFRVLVEGLNVDTSWQDLKDFAREAGKPIFTDVYTRYGERVGVIEYETLSDMENALRKLDDADLKGNRVRERRGGPRRSPDRHHSPNRGRSYERDYGRDRDYSRGYRRDGGFRVGEWNDDYRYPRYESRRSRSRDREYRDLPRRSSREREYRR